MKSLKINIEPTIKTLFPEMEIGILQAEVKVQPSDQTLLTFIKQKCDTLSQTITPETIRKIKTVESLKNAYRKMGKDPSRYRPSAESLLRRIASQKELYYVNNVVDVLNLVSVITGFSICGYDEDKIEGNITLGKGYENEPYQGIGRGDLNIENLPVFRDKKGAFGTPTSDSVRTMVSDTTKNFLMIFPAFSSDLNVNQALNLSSEYLEKYTEVGSIVINIQKNK
jgi:DNA/RNA-binding domain of Phe-tRNA-synthetase-like protein